MAQNVTPTKSNLMATQKSLALAKMGYNLLDKKRNVLIKEMMGLLDDVKLIRDQITDKYNLAYHALQEANISLGIISDIVEDVPVDYGIHVKYRSVMGVELPRIEYEESKLNLGYGFEQANSKVDYAYKCFSDVKELTVKLAEIENSVYRLANAIRQTSTRSNALKNISIPQFEKTVKMISESLEERKEKVSQYKKSSNHRRKEHNSSFFFI